MQSAREDGRPACRMKSPLSHSLLVFRQNYYRGSIGISSLYRRHRIRAGCGGILQATDLFKRSRRFSRMSSKRNMITVTCNNEVVSCIVFVGKLKRKFTTLQQSLGSTVTAPLCFQDNISTDDFALFHFDCQNIVSTEPSLSVEILHKSFGL